MVSKGRTALLALSITISGTLIVSEVYSQCQDQNCDQLCDSDQAHCQAQQIGWHYDYTFANTRCHKKPNGSGTPALPIECNAYRFIFTSCTLDCPADDWQFGGVGTLNTNMGQHDVIWREAIHTTCQLAPP